MPFNLDHFQRRYSGWSLPDLRFQGEAQRWAVQRSWAKRFGRPASVDLAPIVWECFETATEISAPAPDGGDFELDAILAECGIAPGEWVYVDWYLHEQARVPWTQLAQFFLAFWERGVDDLAVFDDSFDWILFISRSGEVKVSSAPAGGR